MYSLIKKIECFPATLLGFFCHTNCTVSVLLISTPLVFMLLCCYGNLHCMPSLQHWIEAAARRGKCSLATGRVAITMH